MLVIPVSSNHRSTGSRNINPYCIHAMNNSATTPVELTDSDRRQICEILERRANDIATFKWDLEKKSGIKFDELPGSVEMAMSREIKRLRRLASKIKPPTVKDQEDEEETE